MKQSISIDEKHTEMVKRFCRIETVEIPKLTEEKNLLIKKKGELIYKDRLQNKPKRKIKRQLNCHDESNDTNDDNLNNNVTEQSSSVFLEKIDREKIFQIQDSIQIINEKINSLNSKYINILEVIKKKND